MNKNIKLIMLLVIALSLAATGCITYNETSDPADPEVVYVMQTPEIVYVTQTPEPTPTTTLIPTPTPTPTPTKVVPIIIPTARRKVSPAPIPVPTAINSYYRLDACIWAPLWDLDTIALMDAASAKGRGHNITPAIEYVTIRVDGALVATIAPAFVHPSPVWNPNKTRRLIECPMLIELPDGILNTGEITMEVSISDTPNLADGIYPMPISVLTPPPRYEDEYSEYPVWNP